MQLKFIIIILEYILLKFITIFLLLAGVGFAQLFIPHADKQTPEYKNFIAQYGMRNLLERVISTDSTFIDTEPATSETFFTFDNNGNLLTAKYKAFAYVVSGIDSFVYDKTDKLQKVISWSLEGDFNERMNIVTVREFVYSNETGLPIKVLHKEIEGDKVTDCGSYDYVYDSKNNLLKIVDNTTIYFMSEAMPRCNYIYDGRGNMIEEESDIRNAKYEYSPTGKLLKSVERMEGLDDYVTTYTYNDEGKLWKKITEGYSTFGEVEYAYAATGVLAAIHEKWTYGFDVAPSYFVYSYYYNVD